MEREFLRLIEETKGTSKKLRELFKKTFTILNKILKSGLEEDKDIEASKTKSLSVKKKRELLKQIYKRTLKKMGQEDNIPAFMKIIDTVPESYIDYELQIDTDKAGELVNDLIQGKGQISANELGNLVNVIQGVGIPAITKYASGEEKLDKDTAEFGAKSINKNVKQYLDSKSERYKTSDKLPSPEEIKEMIPKIQSKSVAQIQKGLVPLLFGGLEKMKDGKLSRLASEIKGSQINLKDRIPDLAKVVKNASDFRDANKLAKENNLELEFKNQSEFEQFLFQVSKAKEYEKRR